MSLLMGLGALNALAPPPKQSDRPSTARLPKATESPRSGPSGCEAHRDAGSGAVLLVLWLKFSMDPRRPSSTPYGEQRIDRSIVLASSSSTLRPLQVQSSGSGFAGGGGQSGSGPGLAGARRGGESSRNPPGPLYQKKKKKMQPGSAGGPLLDAPAEVGGFGVEAQQAVLSTFLAKAAHSQGTIQPSVLQLRHYK